MSPAGAFALGIQKDTLNSGETRVKSEMAGNSSLRGKVREGRSGGIFNPPAC